MDVSFVDQTLRDGQQSLWGMRMRAGMALPVAEDIAAAGYDIVDVTGGALCEVLVRYCREDPWAGLDLLRSHMGGSTLRAGSRANAIVGFGLTPYALLDLWFSTFHRHGVDSFWIYDCLYNIDKMERMCRVVANFGGRPTPNLMLTESPVHTDEYFVDRIRQLASFPDIASILISDEGGVITPERARRLLPLLRDAAPAVPLEAHFHNTTGLAPLNYIEALNAGIGILHTASRPLANGPSLPSAEVMVDNLTWLGHETRLRSERLERIAAHFAAVGEHEGYGVGIPNEYSSFVYQHQLPGGMTGTLKAQLSQYGMQDRYRELLEEVSVVRRELGYPIMATPFSQLVGIQAVLNLTSGQRYSVVPDEIILYIGGHYGAIPGQVDPEAKDRILGTTRAAELERWEPPQLSLKELRNRYGQGLSDEELCLRATMPGEDVDAMYAAGAPRQDYSFGARQFALVLSDILSGRTGKSRAHIAVSGPGWAVEARRHNHVMPNLADGVDAGRDLR